MRRLLIAALLIPCLYGQQDETRVSSPNGQFEFRLFTGQPPGALWTRIGYEVFFHGKPLIAVSWVGIDIRDQEPYLAENPGFMYADKSQNAAEHYNSAIAHYMQNGSLGRRLDIEIRAFDDGVAFRYFMPQSTPLMDFLIRDEKTEFNFADPSVLSHLPSKPDFDLPFTVTLPSGEFVEIAQAGPQLNDPKFPKTYLVRTEMGMITNLSRNKVDPDAAYAAKTPLTWPWRAVFVGADRAKLAESPELKALNRQK
jgi:alpha-glucosidase